MDYKLSLTAKINEEENESLHRFLQSLVEKTPTDSNLVSSLSEDQGRLHLHIKVLAKRNFQLELDVKASSVEEILLLAKESTKEKLNHWYQTRFL